MDYTIESLRKAFEEESRIFDEFTERDRLKFQQEFPDVQLPEHLEKPINLARRLSVICEEIEKLKTKL